MLNVLIISSSEKTTSFIRDFLSSEDDLNLSYVKQSAKARRYALENHYDIIVINYPLLDESDLSLPIDLSENHYASIILLVNNEVLDTIGNRMEKSGVFTIAKPINKSLLYNVIRFAIITQRKLAKLQNNSISLTNKITEIKTIDRAKCLLIEKEAMSENEAHRYIEKKAMDSQLTKMQIAKMIIRKLG